MEDEAQSEWDLLLAVPSSAHEASFSAVRTEADSFDIATYCEKCQEDLDGPCYEHADVKRIIFDKPPIPLAHSSLPDDLGLLNVQPPGTEMVFAKRKIDASTLFGPLIAPLVPLNELEEGPPWYTMWSEEAQELQAYDLSDDFLCNWIKLIRPSSNLKEANVVAYQQRGFINLVAVRDILPSEELRVYVRLPRSGSIPSDQLSALVQSLLSSYNKQKAQSRQQFNKMDIELAPRKRRNAPYRKQFKEAKKVKTTKNVQANFEAEVVMSCIAENSSAEGSEGVEKVLRIRRGIIRSRRTKKVEAPEEQASVSGGSVSVATCSEGSVAGERYSEAPKPEACRRKRGEMVEWRLLNARYKSGDMPEEEKGRFQNDERTIEQERKAEARRLKVNIMMRNKVEQMTDEEREAYLAKKRANNVKNAPNTYKLQRSVREKVVQGLSVPPEELAEYQAYLKRCREYKASRRRQKQTAERKDPETKTAGSKEADAETARCMPVDRREKDGRWLPSYRLKLIQGLPLSSAEQGAYQRALARNREENRRYYRKQKIAQGLNPKEMIHRRKTPLEGPGNRKRISEDGSRNSAEESTSQQGELSVKMI